jgi:flagellar biosynthesis/type III secretory pathway protein FliH
MVKNRQKEEDMFLAESKARYAAWEQRVRGEGIKEGKKAGIKAGKKEGEREIVRKLLTLRFGPLSADAERRLRRASLATLERWAERVLTAKKLADVITD